MAYSSLVESDQPPKEDLHPATANDGDNNNSADGGGGGRYQHFQQQQPPQHQQTHLAVPQDLKQQPRRLSLPFSEQRRKLSYGLYNRTVLCAVDPSEHSKDAFNWYLANVWRTDDLIVVVYCPEPPNFPSFSFKQGLRPPTEKWTEIVNEMNTKAQKLEDEYESMCISKKLRYKLRGESFKNPGEGVCRIAEEEKADLIVMGSRGIGAVKRVLIGSVSEYVVRNASVPCLIVPVLK